MMCVSCVVESRGGGAAVGQPDGRIQIKIDARALAESITQRAQRIIVDTIAGRVFARRNAIKGN